MKPKQIFNGSKLRKAREYRGYTIAELATRVDCKRQTMSMYETGKIKALSDDNILKISEELKFPVSYFYEQDQCFNIGSTYFRALLTTNARYRKEQIRKMEFLSEIYLFIRNYITFPDYSQINDIEYSDPEDAALKLRERWKLGKKPIENLVYTVEDSGIIVTTFNTPTDTIDAFSQMVDVDENNIYLIGYSSNKTSVARIHFDIAHELGHIVLHEWSEDIEALTKEEFRERENEAHLFASAFLLPKDSFYFDIKNRPFSIPVYTELKKKWRVSIAAMARRAYTLDVVSYEQYQNLIITLQKRGQRKEEPLDEVLTTTPPSLLKTAVQILLDENVFTPKEFVDELSYSGLSIYPEEIEFLLDLPKGTLAINTTPSHNLRLIK